MEATVEQCPLCGTELSRVKFREIQTKLREQEQKISGEKAQSEGLLRQRLEQQFKLDLEKQRQTVEKKVSAEAEQQLKKIVAERDAAAKKLNESQQREAELRKQMQQELANASTAAAKKAREEAAEQIRKATAERDEMAKKLKGIKEREAALVKRTQEDAEKQREKDLAEQRQSLEKDKTLALLKQQTASARDREALIKKVQLLENQLQKKTANELGDGAEIDVYEALREEFAGDHIRRIPKGQAGADILHEVLYKGESCGVIVIDSKNRRSWQSSYVTKLREDQVAAGAEHAVLTTAAFPAGKKELCIESGVIVVAPARLVFIAQLLRQAMITMHVKGLSMKERATKMSMLYDLITSDAYTGKMKEATKLSRDMLDLDVQEKTAHDNVWKKRGAIVKRVQNVLREIETEVAAIIEAEDLEGTPNLKAKSIGSCAAAAVKEAVGWSKQ